MPVADALAAILAGADPLPEEAVALDAAHHRILARDLAARRTQPPQAMSAMDGYAVRAADAADLSARLKVIGEVAAGRLGAPTPSSSRKIRRPTAIASPSRKLPFPGGIFAPPASISARVTSCSRAGAASPTAICRSPPA
jgi:hypothetical protein